MEESSYYLLIALYNVANQFSFWPISFSIIYWLIEAFTGNRELMFCSGEEVWEIATTSKEGSRHVNYPILIWRGSNKKSHYYAFGLIFIFRKI